jgi:3'-phosphoadenosine 5'-phosphosulfate (PAPS) 3'-phosphatase
MVSEFVEVARELAVRAGHRLMELRQTELVKTRKPDRSLVTNADHEADQIIRSGLRARFPQHAILTEESGIDGPREAEYVWVVDPMDGTKAYVRGTSGFSVMIGLLKQGKPYAGVVMDPWEGHLYDAEHGAGSFHTLNGRRERVTVSSRRQWREMPLVTSTGFPDSMASAIKALVPCPWLPAINSVGIKVGLLVRQVADLYVNHHAVHYWDTVAPQIILEEAGGIFTFSEGQPLIYDLRGEFQHEGPTLASNGQRHEEFIQKIAGLMDFPASRKAAEGKKA